MKLIFPERTKGNQRLFSEEDVKRMLKIKKLIEEGYTVEAIKNKLKQPDIIKINNIRLDDRLLNRLNKGELSSLYPVKNKIKK